MLKPGDTIRYLQDVREPAHQAGRTGDTRVVGQDITVYHARYLLTGNYVEIVTPEPKPKQPTSTKTDN